MTRQKVNGNRIRSAGNPDEEPDLSRFPICYNEKGTNKQRQLPAMASSSPSSSPESPKATSGSVGRVIASSGSTALLTSAPSPQSSMLAHAALAHSTTDPSATGGMSNRSTPTVGTSPFLTVL
eukprot:jgi/Psemu1/8362/gm1.8362_g